ncbi:DUF4232 domain-containing protein [Streptomyces sp. ET3-23]|uniref:DUF4232 domain-containing protein n=1 Tax=Streptomyces sp. ET3-23 TaxID=2885643 RepID=UPI001D127A28|nr:DUF4232 domain-containing protein [Streptomyces sp. ET3-23]MCC2274006.1 DUF4232 domain-containing protein [Streptomyces sp. ET3-23]
MRVHKLAFAAMAVAAGLSLTACQNGDAGNDGTGRNGPSSASSAASSGGGKNSAEKNSAGKSSGGRDTAAGTGSHENGKVSKCRSDELEITAKDNTIDGDPDGTVVVELKNRGNRTCAISGYAGVDLKTNSGSLSAKRTGEQPHQVVLKTGQSTAFGINYPVNKSGGSGVRITELLVTPPNETKTVTLRWPGAATLPVTDTPGSPVKVGPVGNAGQGG